MPTPPVGSRAARRRSCSAKPSRGEKHNSVPTIPTRFSRSTTLLLSWKSWESLMRPGGGLWAEERWSSLSQRERLGCCLIHPASRGVAAHTAGLFRSVRGAKGGFPPWGLPKLRIPPVWAPLAREFSLFPPVGAPQAREFSLFPPVGAPQAREFSLFTPVGAPQAREFSLFPPVGASQAREFSLFPPWGLPKLGNFHFSPPWGLSKLRNFK